MGLTVAPWLAKLCAGLVLVVATQLAQAQTVAVEPFL